MNQYNTLIWLDLIDVGIKVWKQQTLSIELLRYLDEVYYPSLVRNKKYQVVILHIFLHLNENENENGNAFESAFTRMCRSYNTLKFPVTCPRILKNKHLSY